MSDDVSQTIDELFAEIRLKLFDIRKANPETVEELKSLLSQLEDWVQSLVMDSIRLKEIKAARKSKSQSQRKRQTKK